MRKILLTLAAVAAFCASSASAQLVISRSQSGAVGSTVTATDPSGNTGKVVLQAVTLADTSGNAGGQVQGNVASGTADSGNPVKMGCVYNTALPSPTTGQRVDAQCHSDGSLRAIVAGSASSAKTSFSANAIFPFAAGSSSSVAPLGVSTFLYNGVTQDAAFTCPNTAAVNVTAGATTQIVGLSGSTVIRVCSITLSMSAAGSAGVYTGTGSNCVTGLAALIQDMTLATGTPVAQSAPMGGALIRSSAGGEICVKAVTGNVTGSISYVQF